jgi:hypothetical protein
MLDQTLVEAILDLGFFRGQQYTRGRLSDISIQADKSKISGVPSSPKGLVKSRSIRKSIMAVDVDRKR